MTTTTSAPYNLAHPPLVSSLLEVHREAVDNVLEFVREHVSKTPSLKEAADEAPLDELYALRHVLSAAKNDPKIARSNLIKTLEWRAENLPLLKLAQQGILPKDEILSEFTAKSCTGDVGGLHPLFAGRVGIAKTGKMAAAVSHDELVMFFLCGNEYTYHRADVNTRKSGYLCKTITLFDLEGFSLLNFSRKFSAANGASSHMSAIYYPQLIGKTAVLNAGAAFRMLVGVAKTFMSATVINKLGSCGRTKANSDPKNCPFLAEFLNGPGKAHGADVVPQYIGGPIPSTLSMMTQDERDAAGLKWGGTLYS